MRTVDMIFLGSGIACTTTLIEILEKLVNTPTQKKIAITVVEKHHEFWLGVPYGGRSSVNALTITSIADFFTADDKRASFFEWFIQHKQQMLDMYLSKGGLTAVQWLKRNSRAMDAENWKDIYLPRFIFGVYLHGKLQALLKRAEEQGLINLNLINGEAIDAKPVENDLYEVMVEKPDKSTQVLTAKKVVITTGSAPVREFGHLFNGNEGITYINDLYNPGADINIKLLAEALMAAKEEERNVLVIGSNASSIEFLYLLSGLPAVTGLINKLVVISRSGLLPYHIAGNTLDAYPCENLDKLKAGDNYNIKTLVAAAMLDIKNAVKDGVIMPYIDRIISYTLELLQVLGDDAKKQFIGIYGMQLSNLFRRSGKDYKGGAARMLHTEKLILLKGGFVNIQPQQNGGILYYEDTDTGSPKKYDTPFKVLINCTGANDLQQSSSRLIYNLVQHQVAKVNLSGKGFYVNEKFEAAPNLYVMGPLLGGNMNSRIHFWHLENASRLMYLAPFLVECLLEG